MFYLMIRRSTPQKQMDELAFPVRVKLAIPPNGLGTVMRDIQIWLMVEAGPGQYAQHSISGLGTHATAIYFRDTAIAERFVRAFPNVELADGTLSPVYTSPINRNG